MNRISENLKNIICCIDVIEKRLNNLTQADSKHFGKEQDIITSMNYLQKEIHQNAVNHGWWDNPSEDGTLLALIHSEVSEALEDIRNGKGYLNNYEEDGKPCGVPSELADIVIRCMDFAEYHGIDLPSAIIEKHEYNKSRKYRHGGKVF